MAMIHISVLPCAAITTQSDRFACARADAPADTFFAIPLRGILDGVPGGFLVSAARLRLLGDPDGKTDAEPRSTS